MTKEFEEQNNLSSLQSKVINLKTVSGTETSKFERKKITTNGIMGEEQVVCNHECIVVPEIGHEIIWKDPTFMKCVEDSN